MNMKEMIIAGITGFVIVAVGVWLLKSAIVATVKKTHFKKAEVFVLPSSLEMKHYPYQVRYEYNQKSYQVNLQRYGFPLIGKKKIIMVNKNNPEDVSIFVDVIFNYVMGILFFMIGFIFLLMTILAMLGK